MSSPIGSIEFLIKFDQMQSEFVDALKKALEQADIDIGGGASDEVARDVKEIKFNIENRLRGMFSETDWIGFRELAMPELNYLKDEDTLKELASSMRTHPTTVFPARPEGTAPDDPEWIRKSEVAAQTILDRAGELISEGVLDEGVWQASSKILGQSQQWINSARGEGWNWILAPLVSALFPELRDTAAQVERLDEREGIVGVGQKQWWTPKARMGEGTNLIETKEEFWDMLGAMGISQADAKLILTQSPEGGKTAGKLTPATIEAIREGFEDPEGYYIEEDVSALPNTFLWALRRALGKTEGFKELFQYAGGNQKDVIAFFETLAALEEYIETDLGEGDPELAQEWLDRWEASGGEWGIVSEEFKTTGTKAARLKQASGQGETHFRSRFGGEGFTVDPTLGVQVLKETLDKALESLTPEEKLQALYDQNEKMIKQNEEILEHQEDSGTFKPD